MNPTPRSERMRQLLSAAFTPISLEIKDNSAKHAHHTGHAPGHARQGGESHYTVRIVSESFAGQNRVARHRAVYAALATEMTEEGIHALALETLTPAEVAK